MYATLCSLAKPMKNFTCLFVGKTGHTSKIHIYKPYNAFIS